MAPPQELRHQGRESPHGETRSKSAPGNGARADKRGRPTPARVKKPIPSSKLLSPVRLWPSWKKRRLALSRLLPWSRGRAVYRSLTFAFPKEQQQKPWRRRIRSLVDVPPHPHHTTGSCPSQSTPAATTSEPQPDETLPMDITVRVEVQYHAPAGAVTRDVLEMFRSTTWVRFMMRYISPRLKSSSPADQAILDELESQEAAEVHEGEECVICMSENPCDGHVALPCGHSFHYPCISSWLQSQSTCPVCRFQFPKAFTGKYAVQKLKSSMVLSEEQGKMPRAELLALDIGKQVVRAVVSVTLVKVAAEGDEEEFPCELSAWMLDPSTGETFSELDCI